MPQPIPAPADPPRRRSGNPMGNPGLNLSPRCGARTRAGCPCRAPALRGKARCRRHGGASTGPRTAEGLARLRAARTVHGRFSAAQRAEDRHRIQSLRRSALLVQVMRWLDHLPPPLAARVPEAQELFVPLQPAAGLSPQQDLMVRRLETAALAPWRQAVAAAKQAWRDKRGSGHVPVADGGDPGPRVLLACGFEGKPLVPVSAAPRVAMNAAGGGADATPSARAAGEETRESKGKPRVPVSVASRVAMDAARGGADAARLARPAGAGTCELEGKPHVPVSVASHVAINTARGGADATPFAGAAGAGTCEIEGKPYVPVDAAACTPAVTASHVGMNAVHGEADPTPSAGAAAPAVGMTRAQRKRWKWEQKKARKLAARGVRPIAAYDRSPPVAPPLPPC